MCAAFMPRNTGRAAHLLEARDLRGESRHWPSDWRVPPEFFLFLPVKCSLKPSLSRFRLSLATEAGRRLALYVRTDPDTPETAFRYVESAEIAAFYWIDRPLSYVLTGDVERATLLAAAEAVYDQLD